VLDRMRHQTIACRIVSLHVDRYVSQQPHEVAVAIERGPQGAVAFGLVDGGEVNVIGQLKSRQLTSFARMG
jgi:hypothetical protein